MADLWPSGQQDTHTALCWHVIGPPHNAPFTKMLDILCWWFIHSFICPSALSFLSLYCLFGQLQLLKCGSTQPHRRHTSQQASQRLILGCCSHLFHLTFLKTCRMQTACKFQHPVCSFSTPSPPPSPWSPDSSFWKRPTDSAGSMDTFACNFVFSRWIALREAGGGAANVGFVQRSQEDKP